MLEKFLGSMPRARFLEEYWGRQLFQASSRPLLDLQLFGLQDFVKVAAFLHPCDARVRLVQDGKDAWKGDFRQEHIFSHLTGALSRGMTVSLERLDLFWPPVVELCGTLAAELGCPVHANAYLTPGGALGLNPHYDTHDVFVVQLEGEKAWSLGQIEYQLPTERTADGVVNEMQIQTQVLVQPGDVLYVPRGMAHSARSAASYSLHLTIGCIPYTRCDELRELVGSAARLLPALRGSAAPSTEPPEARRAKVAVLLGQIAELVDTAALQPPRRRDPSQPQGCHRFEDAVMQFRAALDLAGISSASRFSLKQPDDLELVREGDDRWVLRGGTRTARLEEDLLPVTRAILTMSGVFSLKDLPSGLDRTHAVRAIVRLLSSSFLRVLD